MFTLKQSEVDKMKRDVLKDRGGSAKRSSRPKSRKRKRK